MAYTIVGLGNPGEEYKGSRHNSGRMAVESFAEEQTFPPFLPRNRRAKALVSAGSIGKETVTLLLPETFMNRSGSAVAPFVKSKKQAQRLIVVYDDLDLPLGKLKISFGRSSGGHRGVESVARALRTKDFARVRLGIARARARGGLDKPKGEDAVVAYLMAPFGARERRVLAAALARASGALLAIVKDGTARAMNEFN